MNRHLVLDETKQTERPLENEHAQDMAQALKVARNKEIIINNVFVFIVATDIVNYHNLQIIDECRLIHDLFKWKEAIHAKLISLAKCEVFGPIV